VNKDNISRIRVFRNPLEGIQNVLAGGCVVRSIVHQHQHVLIEKAKGILEVVLDITDIIVTAAQRSLLSDVVDTNQDGSLGTRAVGRHNVHGFIDVNHA
jgi:hypothetical protein